MKQINEGWSLGDFVTGIAMVVTTDQWTASTGPADPWKITAIPFTNFVLEQPFSFMAAARGIAIVLTVAYALRKLRALENNKAARRMRRIIISGVIAMLVTETLVITPYSMATLGATPTGSALRALSEIAFIVWAMFVSGMTLGAVALSAGAGLIYEKVKSTRAPREGHRPVGRPPKERETQHQRAERLARK